MIRNRVTKINLFFKLNLLKLFLCRQWQHKKLQSQPQSCKIVWFHCPAAIPSCILMVCKSDLCKSHPRDSLDMKCTLVMKYYVQFFEWVIKEMVLLAIFINLTTLLTTFRQVSRIFLSPLGCTFLHSTLKCGKLRGSFKKDVIFWTFNFYGVSDNMLLTTIWARCTIQFDS